MEDAACKIDAFARHDPSAKCIAKTYLPKRFQSLATITPTARSDRINSDSLSFLLFIFSVISNYIFQSKENCAHISWIESLLEASDFKVKWIRVRTYFERNCTMIRISMILGMLSRVIVNTNGLRIRKLYFSK